MPAPAPTQRVMTPRAWALLAALALVWGGSFVANRAALGEGRGMGVLWVVAIRVGGAALLLWAWSLARGLAVPRGPVWIWRFFVLGVLSAALPFSLIVWGQTQIDSGLASILNASTAIFGVLTAALAFPDERMTPRKALGVALGFAGVVLCVGPGALGGFDPRQMAQLAMLAAALLYSLANVYARDRIAGLPPAVTAAGMLTGAAAVMIPLAFALEGPPRLVQPLSVWAGLVWLFAVSSALAYLLYYRVLALAGAGNFAFVTLMIPPVAIALGALFYGERLPLSAWAGFAVIVAGLLAINPPRRPGPGAKTP